jgi:hypothetical protein
MADPPFRNFTIKTLEQGDIVGGVEFVLRQKPVEPMKVHDEEPEPKMDQPMIEEECFAAYERRLNP